MALQWDIMLITITKVIIPQRENIMKANFKHLWDKILEEAEKVWNIRLLQEEYLICRMTSKRIWRNKFKITN